MKKIIIIKQDIGTKRKYCRGEMKRVFSIILLLLAFSIELSAQATITSDSLVANDSNFYKLRYGGFVGFGSNLHFGNFNQLPGIPNCCKAFETGSGIGFSIGALVEYPITYDIFASTRIGYNSLGGNFTVPEQTTVIIDGIVSEGEFEHYLNTNFSNLELTLLGDYRLWKELFVDGGFKFGYIVSNNFLQKESITKPDDKGTFIDGTRIRNKFSGNIPDINSITAGATIGFHWTLALNRKESLFLSPELFYTYYFTPVVSGLNWNVHTIRFGASVKYKEPPPPPPPPPPPHWPPDPEYPGFPAPPIITANIALIQVDSLGNEKDGFDLRIEDFISLNLRPLLNYIFFSYNSANIPERYIQFSPTDALSFRDKSLENLGVLETYYHILNIIGRRLTDKPDIKITLVGTNSNIDEEKNNKELSTARADSIKNYLVHVWRIEPKRIKVKARNLPKDKSDNSTPEGQAENRRVEILSKDKSLLKPVVTIDTLRLFRDYNLRFFPEINSDAGLSSWKLKIWQGNKTLIQFKGTNTIPDSLDWYISEKDSSAPKRGGKIFYQLTAIDSLGQVAISPQNWIPVEQITIEKKRLSQMEDKEFEYYSLILFDFAKSKLEKAHKSVLKFVQNRIKPDSKITVTGYSDKSGDEKVNSRLSFKRAKAVTKQLKLKNVEVNGVGESVLLYDNDLPEGRFYCRTVKITIENPVIINKDKENNTEIKEGK